jgi:phosphonate transport system substrate-binding protein
MESASLFTGREMVERLGFGTYLAPNVLPVYRFVAERVGERLGVPTELVVETSYESCARDVNDVCFVCSLPYVTFERQGIRPAAPVAAPVLQGERYGGRAIYFSDVIVHRDSPLSSFADLRGRSWSYNEPLSHSGYGITRYHLLSLGETEGYFGRVVEAGFHERSIEMVAAGEVEASAIDSQVLSVALRDDAALRDRLRVIDALGPSTIQPVAVSRRLPDALRDDIRAVLLEMGDDPSAREALGVGLVERFVAVDDSSYDDIRMMLDACERAGFMEVR